MVFGECLRGDDKCHDKRDGPSLNGMPLCCEDPNKQAFAEYIETNDTYHCRCRQASNCLADGDCTCNTKTINTKPPGETPKTQQVCCPAFDGTQCSSYLRVGDSHNSSIPAYCDCDFARIKGSCLRGEQCAGSDKVTGADLNGMPICCANSDHYISSVGQIPDSRDFSCTCAPMQPPPSSWYGNCLRGNSCYGKDLIGLFNGVPVCCPNPSLTYDGISQVGSVYVCSCGSSNNLGTLVFSSRRKCQFNRQYKNARLSRPIGFRPQILNY
ncbi:hypothetical protein LOTGIDRAFT_165516 [Lottia gigantea]|uniref:Uncharacterized protein n=1 Tax=Lottia gigantea TaxID=225164 RepID=V3ZVN1_LOTGI|nr:hypothetical protein LOTGIDRAFT_165516 [Lottia gigantea]ESO88397.1 hypothetical protein LOTGIDRAFT_165516 [Lottia gigantea]